MGLRRWWTTSRDPNWRISDGYNQEFLRELKAFRILFNTEETEPGMDVGKEKEFTSSSGQKVIVVVEQFDWAGTHGPGGIVIGPLFRFRVTIYGPDSEPTYEHIPEEYQEPYTIELPWYWQIIKWFCELLGIEFTRDKGYRTRTRWRRVRKDAQGNKLQRLVTMPISIAFTQKYPYEPPIAIIDDPRYVQQIRDVHTQHVFPDGHLCILAGSGDWDIQTSTASRVLETAIDLLVHNYYNFGLK